MSDRPLDAYVAAVASGDPTPGGGSVVAIVAALAAALGEMVSNLTPGDRSPAGDQASLSATHERLTSLRHQLLAAAPADEDAYRAFLTAVALPKMTDAERETRRDAMQRALVTATDVPLAIATACAELAGEFTVVAAEGNKRALDDIAIGAFLAEAALRGSLANVRGNVALLHDHDAAASYRRRADDLEAAGRAATERVVATVASRRS